MTWILILYMTGHGGAIDHIEFPSNASCLSAANKIYAHSQKQVGAVCVEKLVLERAK